MTRTRLRTRTPSGLLSLALVPYEIRWHATWTVLSQCTLCFSSESIGCQADQCLSQPDSPYLKIPTECFHTKTSSNPSNQSIILKQGGLIQKKTGSSHRNPPVDTFQ
ncbi:hypothetical protein BO82DRAFT_132452 [Aspergillus uvarum CBS 121591]|uniref:Uncharacterized protein n=1 Tax=Aspergillus uvarum CBS 121591 TaxID=1448315 RepID=A0A319CUW5_9EURO|nr:hypothetical protein BO82DRAFT_132452 [Aspergillus uvarum CBS 121591]PYH79398.1 hypothetical protein BO82DRAFT_132452 [Aspergillus uvarum CBS 121591]